LIISRLKVLTLLVWFGVLVYTPGLNAYASQYCANNKRVPVVTVIVPHGDNSSYWGKLVTLMRQAAIQLNIKLNVHYVDHSLESRFSFIESIDNILKAPGKTDYLVTSFIATVEHQILNLAVKHNTLLFSFNAPLIGEIVESIGRPRKPNKNWVGHIAPDDEQVGFDLAEQLVSQSISLKRNVNILAINGPKSSEVAESRTIGLLRRLHHSKNVRLIQLLSTDWSYRNGRDQVRRLLNKNSNIDAIWAGSDELAVAAIDELKSLAKVDRPNLKVASIDWTPKVVPYLRRGELLSSFGGHVFEGVWLLALIHDHYRQRDFMDELGAEISYRLRPIKGSHADLITALEHKKFDFRHLSRCLNTTATAYKFDALSLLSQPANDE